MPLLALLSCGCSMLVIPPAAPAEPLEVFIVDHGRTPSLAIPASDGSVLRFAYGEWRWYALGETGVLRGAAALLWPTQGALGLERFAGPPALENLRHRFPAAQAIHRVIVDAARVRALQRRLLDEFRALGPASRREEVGLDFVRHPQSYHLFNNSNHAVAAWLRELGCETRGQTLWSNWTVRTDRIRTDPTVAAIRGSLPSILSLDPADPGAKGTPP